jgi:hypothetical protein
MKPEDMEYPNTVCVDDLVWQYEVSIRMWIFS